MVVRTLSLVQKCQTSGCSGCSMQWNSGIWWWGHCLWCKKVKPEDAICSSLCSTMVVYDGGDIVFGAKRSNQRTQWMQYTVRSTQWNSGIWWWGYCLWCKKVKPEDGVDAVCSGIVVYGGGDIVFGAKMSNQWMQYAVCSGIVVYGGGDIVFGAKRSNQWMQYAVCS